MLKSLLIRKNKSMYALAKECGISYSTLHYIVNGRTPFDKCSVHVFKKMADSLNMTMEELYKECQYTQDDFEVFKSNIGHYIKEIGQVAFIEEMLLSKRIERLWDSERQIEALYLVATVDYLSRLNQIPMCNKYHEYRTYKLKEPVYPMSYFAHRRIDENYQLKNVIPEFERFGIMEGEILDVI